MSGHESTGAAQSLPEAVQREIAAHHELYRRDPLQAHLWDPIVIGVAGGPVACLLLHHRGRKSGRTLYSILQYYRHAEQVAIVASKGGMANNPAWYLNLVAEPACTVQIATFTTTAIARTVSGEERAQWWSRITREQPVQLDYQARTKRLIPIIVLEMAAVPADVFSVPA